MTERLDAMDGYHALRWLVNEDEGEQDKEARIFTSTAEECGSSGLRQPETDEASAQDNQKRRSLPPS